MVRRAIPGATIRTNGHPRELEYGRPTWTGDPDGYEAYVIYKGSALWLSDFIYTDPNGDLYAAGWHGIMGTSYWDAYVIALTDDGNSAIVGYLLTT